MKKVKEGGKLVISIGNIVPNDWNPNRMSEKEYESLKESIRVTKGKYLKDNPILVRPFDGSKFEIINGEHRWKASKELGLKSIPCEVRKCERLEAQKLGVILNKDRGNIDYLRLSKIFYENWKGIKKSTKTPKYNWDSERLNKCLNAPGTMTQEEIGREFGYRSTSIPLILNIKINIPDDIKENHNILWFSNMDKLNLARVIHPKFQKGLVENCFDKDGNRVWDSVTLSKRATLYNKFWEEIEGKIDSVGDQNKVIDWVVENKIVHIDQVKKKIDSVLAGLKGQLYSDKELGLIGFKPERTTRWDIGVRAKWGPHINFPEKKYHGNFPPQIARNCIWRYSHPFKGEVILDPFVGSGTTMIEAKILGQKGVGIDVTENIINIARDMLKFRVKDRIYYEPTLIVGNAQKLDEIKNEEKNQLLPPNSVDLIVTHPPYWNMVIFSDKGLENLPLKEFKKGLGVCFEQMYKVLKPDHFCCIVIGDVYRKGGEVITLIDETLKMAKGVGFKVYDIAVKFSEGQESMGGLMEWRAEEHNFLIPKHDYVLIFRKGKEVT